MEASYINTMKAVLHEIQRTHNPKHFLGRGKLLPNPEQPERIDILQKGAEAAGCLFEVPIDHGMGPIEAIHTVEYLTFLKTIHGEWIKMPGAADEVIANIHPVRQQASYPNSPIGQAGYYQADTACPISAETWQAAYWSAQTAVSAAELIIKSETNVYALCRPPGHHAFADLAGGFCFLNNSAIAAEHLRASGMRPVIVDVDVHHGNGTQGIFYDRDDVLTISIHAEPTDFYPFFWGNEQERGKGKGLGYNFNFPLPQGTGDKDFLTILEKALRQIEIYGADVIVVALGLDAHETDPFKAFTITTPGFAEIAALIATLKLPTMHVQEGGYLQPALGANLTSYLSGTV